MTKQKKKKVGRPKGEPTVVRRYPLKHDDKIKKFILDLDKKNKP